MRVVQFHTIKAGGLCAAGSVSKEGGQRFWKIGDVRHMRIGNALPITKTQRFEFSRAEDCLEFFQFKISERFTNAVF